MLFKLEIECFVKNYHECMFVVHVGERFLVEKINGPYGLAFRVFDSLGTLGHLR